MAKRIAVHPIFDSSFEDADEILGPLNKDDPNKRKKKLKKSSQKEQHFNFISQPESLFLQFDPKKPNNNEELSEEYSTDDKFEMCTQPAKKSEFRTGKKSWQPPMKQNCFRNEAEVNGLSQNNPADINNIADYNECAELDVSAQTEGNVSRLSKPNPTYLNNKEYSTEYIDLDVSARTVDDVNRLSKTNPTDLNNMEYSTQYIDLDVTAQTELIREDTVQEKNVDDMVNDYKLQQNLSGKIDSDDDNCVSNFESNKENLQEENNIFGSMEVHEIDEMIDKKIEDHLSADCDITSKKNEEPTAKRITVNLEVSDDELSLAASNIGEVDKLSESEDKLLQEHEDQLLENSPLPDPNKLKKHSNESLKNECAENLATAVEIMDSEEENEFDLTISNSQFLQIEKDYSKESKHRKYTDCCTQTLSNFDVANSMRNVPQLVGSVTKYKDNIQKLRQCIKELKKIDAILVKARKEIWMQRNTSQNWNSHSMRFHLPPRS